MPKWQRHNEIYLELRSNIADGTLPTGSALPTFVQLGLKFGVSVATVNKAIAKLKADGLVKTVRGAGVFVAGKEKPREKNSIAVLLPELSSHLYLDMIQGISQEADAQNFHLHLCCTGYDSAKEAQLLDSLAHDRQIKGLILSPSGDKKCRQLYEWMQGLRYPFVFVDRYLPELNAPYVTCDSAWGARLGTEKLIALGHKRIAFVTSKNEVRQSWCKDRFNGYKSALAQAGIAFDKSLVTNEPSGREIKALLRKSKRPTGLFLPSNRYLPNILEGVDLGVTPVTVAGFDEVDNAIGSFSRNAIRNYADLPLIKVIQPFHEMGVQAVRLLVAGIRGQNIPQRQVLLTPHLETEE